MRYIPYIPPYERIPYGFCPEDDEEYKGEEIMDLIVGKWNKIDSASSLPDEDMLCLITIRSMLTGELFVADSLAVFSGGKWIWWVDGYGDEVEAEVTHWAIPFPPEE